MPGPWAAVWSEEGDRGAGSVGGGVVGGGGRSAARSVGGGVVGRGSSKVPVRRQPRRAGGRAGDARAGSTRGPGRREGRADRKRAANGHGIALPDAAREPAFTPRRAGPGSSA
ncbi:hypothetical protein GCM10019016_015770 [Streptomyces prasinosporus]|uniref:Uncharacterized protein n=1 Tax=Streptomyces prasinosporus TaxID=68256 RepID=A0ABP6THP9_9ACTN|nr:hypothetical protein GCM10010332_10150 [Streptomyces albogriseolus]